jgi:polyhydroxyalkanoate synthesis regulator phasin
MAKQRKASGGVPELRDALSAIVDPLGLVMLTRDRIEDALNDAVSRGRVTADDAQELAATLIERGRRQTNDVLGDIEQALAAKAGKAKRAATSHARKAAKGPKQTSGGPGIAGYDDLTAKQVQERLADLTPAKLRKVRDYERAHANRKTVLRAIDQRLK